MPDWLSIVGNCASVAALLMTFFLAWQTYNLRSSVMRRARVPEFRRDLQKMADDLLEYLKNWPRHLQEASALIARIEPVLTNARSKLTRSEKAVTPELSTKVKTYRSRTPSASPLPDEESYRIVWSIQESLIACVETLVQTEKDSKQRM